MGATIDLTCEQVRDLAPAFVLDALEPDEAAAVRAHLAGCEDAHLEIAELASGLPALLETIALVEPPARLKSRVLAAAAADLHARPVTRAAAEIQPAGGQPAPAPIEAIDGRPIPITSHAARSPGVAAERPARPRPLVRWVAALAAVLVIALLGAWNVVLQGQVGTLRSDADSLAAVLRAGATPGSFTAVLAPAQPGGPAGLAALTADGTLVLEMRGLARTTGTEVYQAWVIVPGSAPAPTGSFQVGEAGLGSIPSAAAPVAPGSVVAITREPGPGATAPTLPIIASGPAAKPAG